MNEEVLFQTDDLDWWIGGLHQESLRIVKTKKLKGRGKKKNDKKMLRIGVAGSALFGKKA